MVILLTRAIKSCSSIVGNGLALACNTRPNLQGIQTTIKEQPYFLTATARRMPRPVDGDEGGRMEIKTYLPMQSISPTLWAGLINFYPLDNTKKPALLISKLAKGRGMYI